MSSNHANFDAAATDRKARLAKLAALKRKQPEEDTNTAGDDDQELPDADDTTPDVTSKYLSGRNYDTEARGPKLGFEQGPQEGQMTLEAQAAEIERVAAEEAAAAEDSDPDAPIDVLKLQPKKPNWDLKRDLNEKLNILNVRTDNAIARILRKQAEDDKRAAKERGVATDADGQGEEVGIKGETLVQSIHMREHQDDKSDEETI